MALTRIALVALALVTCAWFVLGIRQSQEVDQVTGIVGGAQRLTPAQASRANSLLRDAGTLNPDAEVDILRGRVAAEEGRTAQANAIFESVGRREPQNIEAWAWLGRTASSRQATIEAYGHLALLAPPVREH